MSVVQGIPYFVAGMFVGGMIVIGVYGYFLKWMDEKNKEGMANTYREHKPF